LKKHKAGEFLKSSDQPGVQFYTANFLPDPTENSPIIGKKVNIVLMGFFA
jgi:hypothetical protein